MSDDPPRRSMVGAPPSARRARGGNTPAQAAATPSRSSARASKRVKKEEPEEDEYKNSDQEKSEEEESENSEDEVAAPTKKTPAGKSKKKRVPLTDYHLKKKKILARKAAREAEKEREAAEEPEEEPEKEPTPPPPRQPPSFSTYEPIQLMQDHIIRKLVEKDPEDYFSYPVTEEMAPDYREIIQTPMDLQTIREKIEDGLYPSLPAMKGDCDLIVSNALQYNQPTTVFYLAAKRLANLINYYFGEPYLRYLFHSLPSANQVPFELAGIRPLAPVPMERPVNRRRAVVQDAMTKDDCLKSADVKVRDRLSANIPPKKMAKMGFLSEKNGTVVLNVLAGDQDPEDKQENSAPARRVTIGDIVGPLEEGTTGMIQMTEHRLYSQTPINYLNYGPFSSFAPMYDTTWSTMTKDDTDLFLRTYGDKANAVGAISMRNFVENCPDFAQAVEKKLNMATDGEHSKTLKAIEGIKEEEEIMMNEDLKNKSVLDLLDDVSSISNFGIDTRFLSDIRRRVLIPPPEPEPSEATETPVIPEYMQQMNHMNVQQQLNHIGQEIKDLVHLQEGRLCQPPPQMLVNVQEPGPIEQKLAESVQQHLAHQMETHTAPEAFVNDAVIHDAIGVNMDDGDDLFSEFFVTQ